MTEWIDRNGRRVQDGAGTNAPIYIYADADYEEGDGSTGLHETVKQANEPAIQYVRADALAAESAGLCDDLVGELHLAAAEAREREARMDALAARGQAQEAYEAQKAAEARAEAAEAAAEKWESTAATMGESAYELEMRLRASEAEVAALRVKLEVAERDKALAADAINRLRAGEKFDAIVAAHTIASATADLLQENTALRAKLEAMRAALDYIMDGYGLNAPKYEQPEDEEDDWIVSHVRAALALPDAPKEEGE